MDKVRLYPRYDEVVELNLNEYLADKVSSIINVYKMKYAKSDDNTFLTKINQHVIEEALPYLLRIYNNNYLKKEEQLIQTKYANNVNNNNLMSPDVMQKLYSDTNQQMNNYNTDRNIIMPTSIGVPIEKMFEIKQEENQRPQASIDEVHQDMVRQYNIPREMVLNNRNVDKTEHMIIMDSGDRNRLLYPNPSSYVVYLSSAPGTPQPHLSRGYKNILSIEVLEMTLPVIDADDPFNGEPYLLLQIDELDNTIDGTNVNIQKSIAKIYPKDQRGSIWVHVPLNYRRIYKHHQLGNLTRLTIRITDKNGNLINFGNEQLDTDLPANKYIQNTISMRITTVEPEVHLL
jgi:hypothetical protein